MIARLTELSHSQQLAQIGELVATGDVHVELTEVLPLTEVGRAHELSESGHTDTVPP